MGGMILGGGMMVGGLILSFIPPFIFGPLLFGAGLIMGLKGMFGTAKTAAKVTAAGVNALRDHQASNDHATRLAELEARERAVAAAELAARERELAAREAAVNQRPA